MLSPDEARRFYDRLGQKQDSQSFYEDPPLRRLVEYSDFAGARYVFEFGCGTGRFAEKLLDGLLPAGATYHGVDISSTMVELSRRRLSRFGSRACVESCDGSGRFPISDGRADRIVSNFVLDLLAPERIETFVQESRRALAADGRLCVASLTFGSTLASRLVSSVWNRVASFRPFWVGGCRPIDLLDFLPGGQWRIEAAQVVVAWMIPSQVVVARPIGPTLEASPERQ